MTNFVKEKFSWDGMYLKYEGDQGDYTARYVASSGCHPSRVGTIKSLFIARFKYGSKPVKSYINFLVKHFTVEQYIEALDQQDATPFSVMLSAGFPPFVKEQLNTRLLVEARQKNA